MDERRTGAVTVDRRGPVAVLVLDNPVMRNALTQDMWRQLPPLLAQLADDDTVKVLVVRGAGDHFSAGADIASVQKILHDPATVQEDGGDITVAEEALAAFPKPTIAAIDGYCVGGGWQIAGACDLRLASERAVYGITPAKIGIVYPLSGIKRLVQLVGPATAKYLLFTGDFVAAGEALGLGLATKVLPTHAFWDDVAAFALRLASGSQFSIRAQKDLINLIGGDAVGAAGSAAALAERNLHWQREMAVGEDAAIGVAAFLAKKTPHFTWVRTSE
ncbi:enoyl-CoA hydratase/isomerase family protein [Arthrobacter sp. H35-D1]|uniref:enoyl-CoA hydratase/isomerase family protein n=1 Tax=Arthrobacter sp. H35-D1 TaxID=3046202 RepID=UPI0024B8A289|nr:enoyl-CoA hydratase/isomerase family protein [Arthrobacter sp. H35-D1]MDJ0314432.1 enoyl-CoA hydratase/isomerase family protein [Arthrobacter sp. H35-D1]